MRKLIFIIENWILGLWIVFSQEATAALLDSFFDSIVEGDYFYLNDDSYSCYDKKSFSIICCALVQ